MIKYTRKDIAINRDAQLHDKLFVVYDDVETLIMDILNAAVEAGADEDRLMEMFNEKD